VSYPRWNFVICAGLHEQDKADIIMLHTLVLWKANPSTMTRIVDVKLVPFFER
jgi:hypothetical protein